MIIQVSESFLSNVESFGQSYLSGCSCVSSDLITSLNHWPRKAPGQQSLGAEDFSAHQLGQSGNFMPTLCGWKSERSIFMDTTVLISETAVVTCSGSSLRVA